MSSQRYLIDTNVFIGLEDDIEVAGDFSLLMKLTSKHNIKVFAHEAAKDDIKRDRDAERRKVSLSKLEKFETIKKVQKLTEEELSAEFGSIGKPNDIVDATLLHALSLDLADFLVTEDRGLHDRARKHTPSLARRILFVADAVALLKSTYEPVETPLRYVEEVDAHTIPKDDPIFESLREDYDGFDNWWQEKCVGKFRKCWVVQDDTISGIIVRKDEGPNDTDALTPAEKILKICTFKVRPENRGVKLGELLLKQVFWYAQNNGYDLAYVTTYAKQVALIDLLEYYGFQQTASKDDGELIYEKTFSSLPLSNQAPIDLYTSARLSYPRFYTGSEVSAYGIPIKEKFHDVLFPELKDSAQSDLFDLTSVGGGPRRPGNTIRKVYLCRAKAKMAEPGAILFFYKGVSNSPPSQAFTAMGVLEDVAWATSTQGLMKLAGGRSVYSEKQLIGMKASAESPVRVINFLLVGYFTPAILLDELQSLGVMAAHPAQSAYRIETAKLKSLLNKAGLGFEI